jgi:hypothetical protein
MRISMTRPPARRAKAAAVAASMEADTKLRVRLRA